MATIIGDQKDNTLVGFAERDLIQGLGGADRLFGRGGNDTLEGGDGNDRLRGEGGSDLLRGGAGSDQLFGDSGRDTLVGGSGRDYLTGGVGADTFRFDDKDAGDATAGLADVILDFSAVDIIDLRAVDLFRYDGYSIDPGRGAFGVWQAHGNTYVTWNTFNSVHDIEIRGYLGDLEDIYNQIVWYDDDYRGGHGTNVTLRDGETKNGKFEVAADSDWFKVELVKGRLYTFDLGGALSGEGTARDTVLALYDVNGDWVADDYPWGGDARMFYEATVSGTYYVQADSWSNSGIGSYRLSMSSRVYVDDFGNTKETAGEIAAGDTVDGEVGLPYDEDYFHLEAEAGKKYTVDLRGLDSKSGTLPDPLLYVIDSYDNWWDDNDGGEGRDARFTFTAEEAGDYYIVARGWDWADIGTYELRVTVEDALVV